MAVLATGLLLPAQAIARAKPEANKKLYCWNENGQRKCADSLPPEAMAAAREEISVSSGLRTGEVQRAMTGEERAAQAEEEAKRKTEALAVETRRRTDKAMLTSFQTEEELRRVFAERINLVDNSINTARFNVNSLREGLVTPCCAAPANGSCPASRSRTSSPATSGYGIRNCSTTPPCRPASNGSVPSWTRRSSRS